MSLYKCRIPERDGQTWYDISDAHYPEMAARLYAESEDSNSAMELFEGNSDVLIEVQDIQGIVTRFNCSREFNPMYTANEIDPKPTEPDSSGIPY